MPDDDASQRALVVLNEQLDEIWRYLSLITAQHNQQPRYMETVALSVRPAIDGLTVTRILPTLFDVLTAVGQQLDFTGQWIGLSRRIAVEAEELFFSWDEEELGYDDAEWMGQLINAHEHPVVVLDDERYRLVLLAKIAANHWNGEKEAAYDAWRQLFTPMGYQILIQENFDRPVDSGFGRCTGNMHMWVMLIGPPPDRLLEALFAGGYFDLRPAGVGMGYFTTQRGPGTTTGYPVFGFDMGPDPEAEDDCFSWDIEGLGWDEADWCYRFVIVAETFSWDEDGMGWDEGDWDYRGTVGIAVQELEPVRDRATPEPIAHDWIAGWDIGAWAKELKPLHLADEEIAEAA